MRIERCFEGNMIAFRHDFQALTLDRPVACGKEMVGLRRNRRRWRTIQ